MDTHREAQVLLVVGDRKPVLDQDDAGANQHLFELGNGAEKLLVLVVGAKAHDLLNPRAVVPAAVEEDDFAAGRQMRNVALEVPLAAFALARRRQCGDAADARIEALRDALDDAALAGRVAPFKEHDHLEFLVHDPVLQFDEFALQTEKLLEIEAPAQAAAFGFRIHHIGDQRVHAIVVDLHLQLFVKAIEHLVVDAGFVILLLRGFFLAHRGSFPFFGRLVRTDSVRVTNLLNSCYSLVTGR